VEGGWPLGHPDDTGLSLSVHLGKTGLAEMGIGETGVGEKGLGETRLN